MDDQVELSDAYGVTDACEQFSPTSSSFVSSFPLTLHYWRFVRKSTVCDESLFFVSYFSRLRRKVSFLWAEKSIVFGVDLLDLCAWRTRTNREV